MELMLDLETLGTRPGSAIRSIGAAAFELGGDGPAQVEEATFSSGVRALSCWVAGLTIDQGTLDWWAKQDQAAKDAAHADQRELREVVDLFHAWYGRVVPHRVWCQGAGFDTAIWERAAAAVGKPVPWRYWSVMCTRTIYCVARFDPRTLPFDGTAHSALDDALHQIRCVQRAYKMLNGASAPSNVVES